MIKKIISGGQSGADLGALMAAKKYGLETGGVMPNGFITQGGTQPQYAKRFGMTEHASPKYAPRTYENVKNSDATLRIAADFNSSGEKCTLAAIVQYKKPYLDIDVNKPKAHADVITWLERHNVQTLNVAGNSERTYCGMTGETIDYLTQLFSKMGLSEVSEITE